MTAKPKRRPLKVDVDEPITAENYVDRACAYIRAHKGEGVVIVSPTAPQPLPAQFTPYPPDGAKWRAWLTYLASKRIPTNYAKKIGCITVPADWPELFDPAAPQSDPFPPPLPPKPPATYSAATGPALAQMARDISPWPARREKRETDARFAQTPQQEAQLAGEAEAALAALRARNEAEPVAAPGRGLAAEPDEFDIPFEGA